MHVCNGGGAAIVVRLNQSSTNVIDQSVEVIPMGSKWGTMRAISRGENVLYKLYITTKTFKIYFKMIFTEAFIN